ncbi:MAG: thiolase family protein [Deltaproteobacteria bacterium]|nr:thiolase family protein [Deltaproteobacteria bacterium]
MPRTSDRLRAGAAIVGFGDAYADTEHRKDPIQLAAEATRMAIADAGIRKDQITGIYTGRAPWADMRPQWNNVFSSYMQLPVEFSSEITTHGGGVNAVLGHAALLVTSGFADYVLCLQSDAMPLFQDTTAFGAAMDADPQFERPYGPLIASLYAQAACRYMHEYGISEQQMARVAVAHQDWAVHHPYATKRAKGKITVQTVLDSPYVATPLHYWNCAAWGPGGTAGAFIVTTAERAEAMTERPIYILGFGHCSSHEYLTDRMALRSSPLPLGTLPNLTTLAAKKAAEHAYEMAQCGPRDIDIVEAGGNFTHTVMMLLEDFGFCEKGAAGRFVEEGHIDVGGDLPMDTNGGWLSYGQPGISCGIDPIVEAVRQLRGEALGLQVAGARTALTHATGGMLACHGVTILGTRKD